MKIYGYKDEGLPIEEISSSELAEITLVANPHELRIIAQFLASAAQGMESRGKQFEHVHLSDQYAEFKASPHFVVFNPEA